MQIANTELDYLNIEQESLTSRLPRLPGLSTNSFFRRFSQSVDM